MICLEVHCTNIQKKWFIDEIQLKQWVWENFREDYSTPTFLSQGYGNYLGIKRTILDYLLSDPLIFITLKFIIFATFWTFLLNVGVIYYWNVPLSISVRDKFVFRGAEVSCPNIFSIACTKIKWICPNITWFFGLKMAIWKNSRGAAAPLSPMGRMPMPLSHIKNMFGYRYTLIIICTLYFTVSSSSINLRLMHMMS